MCFESRVDHRTSRSRHAHDRRPYVEALLEPRKTLPAVAAVVRIHEDVRARLQLVVNAACLLEKKRAGTGAGDHLAVQPLVLDEIARAPGLLYCLPDRRTALLDRAQMLRRAMVGMHPGKSQVAEFGHDARETQRWLARLDAAAVAAHIDLDQHVHANPRRAGRVIECDRV